MSDPEAARSFRDGSGPLDDLALTLPVFVGYHLGVVFLPVRNAVDMVTNELVALADHNLLAYSALTLAIGVCFAAVLLVLGRRQSFRWQRFALVGIEGILYAIAMRLCAGYVVGKLHLAGAPLEIVPNPLAGVVIALGAGFYEELVFRVVLFGLGLRLVASVFAHAPRVVVALVWAVIVSVVFSGWHYVGELGDPFELRSFVFRAVCGLVFTVIYTFRGFAPAVWTHALYDVWVLAL